jgi:hypothetical protein
MTEKMTDEEWEKLKAYFLEYADLLDEQGLSEDMEAAQKYYALIEYCESLRVENEKYFEEAWKWRQKYSAIMHPVKITKEEFIETLKNLP